MTRRSPSQPRALDRREIAEVGGQDGAGTERQDVDPGGQTGGWRRGVAGDGQQGGQNQRTADQLEEEYAHGAVAGDGPARQDRRAREAGSGQQSAQDPRHPRCGPGRLARGLAVGAADRHGDAHHDDDGEHEPPHSERFAEQDPGEHRDHDGRRIQERDRGRDAHAGNGELERDLEEGDEEPAHQPDEQERATVGAEEFGSDQPVDQQAPDRKDHPPEANRGERGALRIQRSAERPGRAPQGASGEREGESGEHRSVGRRHRSRAGSGACSG